MGSGDYCMTISKMLCSRMSLDSLQQMLDVEQGCLGPCCCCSVTQSCLTLCHQNDCSTPGFPVLTISQRLLWQTVKHLPAMQETRVLSLGWEDLLEKEMATHSCILAWRIPQQRSLVGCSPRGRKESDMTEWVLCLCLLHVHWVSDALQPSHPLSPPSPPALNPS